MLLSLLFFFFQAEDGIRDRSPSRGLGDVYKRQGLDYEWFGIDVGQCRAAENIQRFLAEDGRRNSFSIYEVDGSKVGSYALHPTGLPATIAQGSLAVKDISISREWIERFYHTELRNGRWRYYDNCLYFFAFLALSGNYRIY